jgi:hypothetical protein
LTGKLHPQQRFALLIVEITGSLTNSILPLIQCDRGYIADENRSAADARPLVVPYACPPETFVALLLLLHAVRFNRPNALKMKR